MSIDIQYQLNTNPKQKQFLRENSYWYKYLNRSNAYYKPFINDMKDKYKLKPTDRLNKMLDDIDMVRSFLDLLK